MKQNEGGDGLWHYHRSLPDALKAVYPEYPWEMHRFAESGHFHSGYWSNITNQREYLEQIGNNLGIQQVCVLSFPPLQTNEIKRIEIDVGLV